MSVEYIANVGAIMQRKKAIFFLQMEDFFSCNCNVEFFNVEFINSATKTRA